MRRKLSRLHQLGVLAAVIGLAGGGASIAIGSDHQDTPEVELNPKMDMTDVYAFPGGGTDRIALVMNSRAFLTPAQTSGASFDQDLLYQFKIDNDGDAVEDKVIQVVFTGTGANQTVKVYGPIDPPVLGAMMNPVADATPALTGGINQVLGSANGMQVFAGPRDDPFFIDLEAAFCILPDRRPVTGPLSQPCQLSGGAAFRPAGQAANYVNGFNVLSIVIELAELQLTAGGNSKIGIWGTISR
jgi:Domain of unknown function (DUF4331)